MPASPQEILEKLETTALPQAKAEKIYAELTRGRGASHHLQVKDASALLYRVLDAPNPFAICLAPKFQVDAVEIRHLEAGALGKVLLELWRACSATSPSLFFTACQFHEWALLRLVRDGEGKTTAARAVVRMLAVTGRRFTLEELRERLGELPCLTARRRGEGESQ